MKNLKTTTMIILMLSIWGCGKNTVDSGTAQTAVNTPTIKSAGQQANFASFMSRLNIENFRVQYSNRAKYNFYNSVIVSNSCTGFADCFKSMFSFNTNFQYGCSVGDIVVSSDQLNNTLSGSTYGSTPELAVIEFKRLASLAKDYRSYGQDKHEIILSDYTRYIFDFNVAVGGNPIGKVLPNGDRVEMNCYESY